MFAHAGNATLGHPMFKKPRESADHHGTVV
jgi:hypothetical protein